MILHVVYSILGVIDTVLTLACLKTAYHNKLDCLAVFSNKMFVIILILTQCAVCILHAWVH